MTHIAVIGAGITGVTSAYALLERGYTVTVLDRHRYPGMETSYANGGQLSACNAEVWNSWGTVLKGIKWMLQPGAPLLLNPLPGWHKYSWLAEFVGNIGQYRANTVETVRLAIQARALMFSIAEKEGIDFDLEKRGILHIYRTEKEFAVATKVNRLLAEGGLERHAVTPTEIRTIEPTLQGSYHGGYFTPADSTGDIHKFSVGLGAACARRGVRFIQDVTVSDIASAGTGFTLSFAATPGAPERAPEKLTVDGVVIAAGVASRGFAASLGDRINIYPVKGYSLTIPLEDEASVSGAPWVSLLDEATKIVTSRLGRDRFRIAGTAEFNGENRDIRADRIKPLVDWTRALFPGVSTEKAVPWTGLRPMTPSMMPKVGRGTRAGVFYNTGHGHLGWTLSAATADLLAATVSATLPPA